MIEREDERLAPSTPISVRVTRRALLGRVAALSAAWTVSPWVIDMPAAFGKEATDPGTTETLEALADTLIPGQKRSPTDRAIAGAAKGPGAVQAGALRMLEYPGIGLQQALPVFALAINLYAFAYAVAHKIKLDLTVPAFVALDFESRTALLVEMLKEGAKDRGTTYALASLVFVAYHTAGYLPTATAIKEGHPGLAAIGFPAPYPDGIWRFPKFSYRRALARAHPNSRGGNPA